MDNLIRFKQSDLAKITNFRNGEIKFGEKMLIVPKDENVFEFIKNCEAQFVILGIPEDVGVRANLGRAGAESAWKSAIASIANIQHNKFCKGNSILVLGQVDTSQEIEAAALLDENNPEDRKKLFKIVEQIDKEVSHIIFHIVKAGKTPIIIGGGHNNAYGNIKGTALAKGKPINAINFDPHSDFRILEGRHSGNGFSYAYDEGFLKNYFIFGLHESYSSKNVLDNLKSLKDRVKYNTYDEIKIRSQKSFSQELFQALEFIKQEAFGIEIDLDAIPGIASSAMTLSGFSVEELRQFIHYFGNHKNAAYLHICEGAPSLGEDKNNHLIGKLIGYLVTDFIKAYSTN
ncbi:formimidoylglutamase [Flavobacterium luminosum]|uniref:Formimidoylglutamase n=1 Tax=Flavobacterium luminosum TaxID=2949086 RepID=A0ABT0TME1_9FLAO|nr:formimidoylglutamase [Flavobacterium sp. HXWNR70]MCL9808661.1 formimidoylglutamase [Flavobacterium sp. HXWNR70]